MANKRRKRAAILNLPCPHCDRRLWRLGSQKHFLFYQGAAEITQFLGMTRKKATLLATQGIYVDRQSWLEEFMCGEDGRMWLLLQSIEGQVTSKLAQDRDWKRTAGTIDPTVPNASVSEFTYRMSRQTDGQLRRFYNL